MDKDNVIEVLNGLIETSKDGEYGFRICAKRASSPELQQVFSQRAGECATGAAELHDQIKAPANVRRL